eukprot:TRINITY_DN51802_c0_g1_i1.p1 TRINITY_DN51802_c0_g1~~TRINITY_DN51802_c0_g1_i1.p1  ORF type:complete len:640 (+),score=119.27 TRINITY_DN51802_c0_g1_i1:86-1921(+)
MARLSVEAGMIPPLPTAVLWQQQQAKRFPRVDVSFPELPSDADTMLPSWRSGLHSDWKLRLGQTVYNIHKVLTGHGPRASAFLCSAFTTGQQLASGAQPSDDPCYSGSASSSSSETDLSHIIPEQVWPFFSQALDYIYSEELNLCEENTMPLLRCADVLQIRPLFLKCIDGINELLSVSSAPRILADSVSMLGGPLSEQIQKAAQDVIAEHFEAYSLEDLQCLPTASLANILRRDFLGVMHENEVYDCVSELVSGLQAADRSDEALQLWQCVRFGALSNSYIVRAAQVDTIPKMALIWSKVLHRKYGSQTLQMEQHLSEGWPVGPPRPRKPFKDLVCAVMYSVDTDARNDQDVERNITAATLVAEEIDFLGGRAILENIFARPPSAREAPDSSIINMDQVDVAFVLAPWTPSEKRISRLINFVDQGGGAVLLSFIGGLSKGVWRDMEYEPLITGKVADNTPYEDVYLSSIPDIASLDMGSLHGSLKRSQDTLTPPRILCGVDSINGRRRITSKLVEGAKVLAKWSDGQPLVVQHPDKNVFSVSQRVSRIFELDEDLGHDDTLQLVLNVMVKAGKEAKRLRAIRSAAASSSSGLGTVTTGGMTGPGGVNVSL